MSEYIEQHSDIIEALAPKANSPEFSRLLLDKTEELTQEQRFILKMEIKRLAKPCLRKIDLRIMVSDECKLIDHKGIQHYLNDSGLKMFNELIEKYGEYTFGVYESLLRSVEQHAKNRQPEPESIASTTTLTNEANWQKYLTPYNDLMFYHHRRDERMNYVVELELVVSPEKTIRANSVDISHRGLKIKLDNIDDLSLLKSFRPIMVIFTGFHHSSGLTREPIEYNVVRITGENQQCRVHLSRDWQLGPKLFNDYLSNLIKYNKRRYKVNLENTLSSVEGKIFEQAFASNTPSLSLYVNTQGHAEPFVEYACVNSVNSHILDYWLDEEKNHCIGFMLNKERLSTLLADNSSSASLFVYSFNHIKEGKTYFYSATPIELSKNPELANIFLGYASRKVSWRVFKVSIDPLNNEHGYLPSSIPNGVNKNVDRANRPLTPRLLSKLQHISHLLTVTDITTLAGQQCYQQRHLIKGKIRELALFGHPRNRPPKPIQVFRYTHLDQRKEIRYHLRTATIANAGKSIRGVTEDISVSGLRIELNKAIDTRRNDLVTISLPNLQDKTDEYDLSSLKYRVKHISDDKKVLHLQTVSDEVPSTAELFFKMLIEKNKDKLGTVTNGEAVPGMGKSLRAIQSKTTPQLCAYIQRKPIGYVPVKATTCNPLSPALSFMRHQVPMTDLNLSWLFQDRKTSHAFVQRCLKTLKFDQTPISSEIFVSYDSHDLDPETAILSKWDHELETHQQKYKFIINSLESQQFFAFRITFNSVVRPDMTLLQDELNYLGQYAIHKARDLEELMWSISGEIYITDITDEMVSRYQLNK